jgi:hypothetical protein
MEKMQASKLPRQLKRTFCEPTLNALGKRVGFRRRKRELTPHRLCLGLVETMRGRRWKISLIFSALNNALCASNVQYKSLPNQLVKRQFQCLYAVYALIY